MEPCRNCGNLLEPDDLYCKKCGAKTTGDVSIQCSNCGNILNNDDKFCKKCGTPVSQTKSPMVSKYFTKNLSEEELQKENEEKRLAREQREAFLNAKRIEKELQIAERQKSKELRKVEKARIAAEKAEAKRLEKERIAKVKEEQKLDQEKKTEEERLRKAEEDRIRLEEQEKKRREEEERLIESERIRAYEEHKAAAERLELQKKARKAKEERLAKEKEYEQLQDWKLTNEPEANENNEPDLTDTQKLKLRLAEGRPLQERKRLVYYEKIKSQKKTQKSESKNDKSGPSDELAEKEKIVIRKQKKNWKKFFLPFVVLCLIGATFFGYNTMKSYATLDNVVQSYENSINSLDSQLLARQIKSTDDSVAYTNITLLPFVKMITDDSAYREKMISYIREDAAMLEKDPNYVSNRYIRLIKEGKKLLLFDDYKVVMDPLTVDFQVPDSVDVLLNNKLIKSANMENTGPFVPGKYSVTLQSGNISFVNDIILSEDTMVSGKVPISYEAELYADGKSFDVLQAGNYQLKINTNNENAIVVINNKNTGFTVKDFNKLAGKNLKAGDKIKVVITLPWGFIESEEVTLKSQESITLDVELANEASKKILINLANLTLHEEVQALNNLDASLYTTLVDPELKDSIDIIESMVEEKTGYVGAFYEMKYDLDSFEIVEDNGEYTAYIGGYLTYREDRYSLGDAKVPDLASLSEEEKIVGFHFEFDEKTNKWMVNDWGTTTRNITRNNLETYDLQ